MSAVTALTFGIFANDNTQSGLNSASSGFRKLSKGIGLIGAAGAALGGGAFLKSAISASSDLEESTSKVRTLFGKAAADVEAFGAKSATAYGMSKREAMSAVGTMGAVQIAMGVNEKQAAKTSLEYTKLSADLASFNNASSAEVQEALTGALSGEYEMLKKYGIVVNDSTMALEAQRIGMKKNGATWDAAQKQQLSHNIIMASTKKAQGDFARTSGGLANQQKILGAQFDDVKAKIGRGLLPVVTNVVTVLNEKVIPAVSTFFNALTGKSEIGEFSGGMGKVNDAGVKMGEAIRKVGAWIKTDFLPVVKSIASWLKDKAWPAVRDFAKGLWTALQPAIKQIGKTVKEDLVPAIKGLIGKFKEVWPNIKRVIDILREVAQVILTKVVPVVISLYGKYLSKLIGVFGDVIVIVGKVIGAFAKVITTGVRPLVGAILGMVGTIISAAAKAFGWVPGLGDKLEAADRNFRQFRSSVDRQLRGLEGPHLIKVDVAAAAAEARLDQLQSKLSRLSRARGGAQISTGTHGGITARAGGGPVLAGQTYLVGEKGPELVTMTGDGHVSTAAETASMRSRGGGSSGSGMVELTVNLYESDGALKQKIRKIVRTDGGGSAQVAFGRG